MKIKIEKISERPIYLKLVVYGEPGIGKTVFSSTAPKPLFIDAENGTLSIAKKNIDRVKINKFEEIGEVFWYLKNEKHNYETVILDSLTEIQKKSMDGILEKSASRDKEVPLLQDWAKSTEQMRKLIRSFRDLDMHVIFTCLQIEEKDDATGEVLIRPAVSPKVASTLFSYVDIVGYMFTQLSKDEMLIRRMLFQPRKRVTAKDRSGKLPTVLDTPTFTEILRMVKNGN